MKTIAQKHAGGGVGAPASGPLSRRTFLKTTVGAAAVLAAPSAAWAARGRPKAAAQLPVHQRGSVEPLRGAPVRRHAGGNAEHRSVGQARHVFRALALADPLCSPSRTCWFTGRAPTEHGVVYNNRPEITLRPEIPDLGAWLRDAGYETFYAGKWHVPGRRVESSFHALQEASSASTATWAFPAFARPFSAITLPTLLSS